MAAGQLVGVVPIAHFTCSHARPFPSTLKTKRRGCGVRPPPHARCFIDGCTMPAAPCTMIFPDLWYLHSLPAASSGVSQHSRRSVFDIVAAFGGF